MAFFRGALHSLSNDFGQFGLTALQNWVENKDTYYPSKMSKSEKLAPVLALGAMLSADPALAESKGGGAMQLASMTQTQVTDCVAFVKDQRKLAAENGIKMSRKDQKLMLLDCQGDRLDARIAQQQEIIAALNDEIKSLRLSIDENGQITDQTGEAIGQIVLINNQLVIQRKLENRIAEAEARTASAREEIAASRARQEAMLVEAERILQRLATS